jgi:hypothetical protein
VRQLAMKIYLQGMKLPAIQGLTTRNHWN